MTLFLKATHKKTLKKWTIERRTKKTVRWTCEKNQDYITVDVPRISMGCQSDFHSTTVCYLYCNRNKIWLILLRSCALLLRIPHLIPIGKKQTQNPINKGRKNSENGNRKMCPTREIKFYFSNTPQIASFETNNQFYFSNTFTWVLTLKRQNQLRSLGFLPNGISLISFHHNKSSGVWTIIMAAIEVKVNFIFQKQELYKI